MTRTLSKTFLAGLVLLIPTWATILILFKLFTTLDSVIGSYMTDPIPGSGFLFLVGLLIVAGIIADHLIGEKLLTKLEKRLESIPLVQTIYLTLKGMTDIINFRSRFGHSKVVAFPFPRNGLWALGFVMGTAPNPLQIAAPATLYMIFVPTAIHPFTGYLAFIPGQDIVPLKLAPEEAMKMEFSAGFYQPQAGWMTHTKAGYSEP
jgi:uncharacterized membrane protein